MQGLQRERLNVVGSDGSERVGKQSLIKRVGERRYCRETHDFLRTQGKRAIFEQQDFTLTMLVGQ